MVVFSATYIIAPLRQCIVIVVIQHALKKGALVACLTPEWVVLCRAVVVLVEASLRKTILRAKLRLGPVTLPGRSCRSTRRRTPRRSPAASARPRRPSAWRAGSPSRPQCHRRRCPTRRPAGGDDGSSPSPGPGRR